MIAAIPTRYNGVEFRSRLEARWAAFFDLLEWKWEYEPIDLDGYIPDFVLGFKTPVLVEVKPLLGRIGAWASDDGFLEALAKLAASGWTGHSIVVGASLDQHRHNDGFCASGADPLHGGQHLDWFKGSETSAPFGFKACCGGPVDVIHSYACLRCGHYDGNCDLAEPAVTIEKWREAGNRVQWRGQKTMATHTSKKQSRKWSRTRTFHQAEPPRDPKDIIPREEIHSFFASLDDD